MSTTRELVSLSGIVLNPANFRHQAVDTAEEALRALYGGGRHDEMLALARDIVARGLDPSNLPIVEPVDGYWRVLEGNRRLATMKVLSNPELLPDIEALGSAQKTAYRAKFRSLANEFATPSEILCVVTDDEEYANHLIMLKHTGVGQHQGAGTVMWGTEGRARYEMWIAGQSAERRSASNSQAARAIHLLDLLDRHFDGDSEALAAVSAARAKGLTVLGRLLTIEGMHRLGLKIVDGELTIAVSDDALRATMLRVLTDMASPEFNTRTLNSTDQRLAYFDKIQGSLPGPSDRVTGSSSRGGGAPPTGNRDVGDHSDPPNPPDPVRPPRRKRDPVVKYAFKDLRLVHTSPKTEKVRKEFSDLLIEDFPYIVAASIRMFIDLYTADVWKLLNPNKSIDSPSERARKCLGLVDDINAKSRDRKFPHIHNALVTQTGDLSLDTMNGFMHRPSYHPTADTIRVQVEYYEPFLRALDAEVTTRLHKQ